MTTPPFPTGNQPANPGLVIQPGARVPRQPLGLPAGSVRALLTFMILGLIWALLLLPEEKEVKIPLYLYYLMFLILGHFFAAHGHSIAGPATGTTSPLYLPRGTLRTLVIVGFLGVLGYRYYLHRNIEDLLNVRGADASLTLRDADAQPDVRMLLGSRAKLVGIRELAHVRDAVVDGDCLGLSGQVPRPGALGR